MRIAAFVVPALVGIAIGASAIGFTGGSPAAAQETGAQATGAPAACPDSLASDTPSLTCGCSAEAVAADAVVWGTNIYTDDSNICRAARHTGVIGSRGGVVTVRAEPGRPAYAGSTANDIVSNNWPAWQRSIVFAGGPPPAPATASGNACPANALGLSGTTRCGCSARMTAASGGFVWGSGPYTGDSNICRAARHAGVIGARGGSVSIRVTPGRRAYAGSRRNGVTTSRWATRYPSSFTVSR